MTQKRRPPISKIREIPSLRKRSQELELVELIGKLEFLRPVLQLVGHEKIFDAVEEANKLAPQMRSLIDLPDRFNDLFADRGWILYDSISHDAALTAINAAEKGRWDEADDILASQYDKDNLDQRLLGIRTLMKPERWQLLSLARTDFLEARYHASIPVVLAQMDGWVQDLSPNNHGFFAGSADMTAWDSITANELGLQRLHALLFQTRGKTTADELTIPFRNGILHGRDLGYANRISATKTWASLFAVGEWARKARNKDLAAPPPPAEVGLLESIQNLARSVERGRRGIEIARNWTPRRAALTSITFAATGDASPELAVYEFLESLTKRRFDVLVRLVPRRTDDATVGRQIHEMKVHFKDCDLVGYELIDVEQHPVNLARVRARLSPKSGVWQEFEFRLVYENEKKEWVIPGADDGAWVILNWHWLPSDLIVPAS